MNCPVHLSAWLFEICRNTRTLYYFGGAGFCYERIVDPVQKAYSLVSPQGAHKGSQVVKTAVQTGMLLEVVFTVLHG